MEVSILEKVLMSETQLNQSENEERDGHGYQQLSSHIDAIATGMS